MLWQRKIPVNKIYIRVVFIDLNKPVNDRAGVCSSRTLIVAKLNDINLGLLFAGHVAYLTNQ